MQAMVPNLYGSWRGPIREALAALLTAAAGDPVCPLEATDFRATWDRLSTRIAIRTYWEDLYVRPLVYIAALDLVAAIDCRHMELDRAVIAIDKRFTALDALREGRDRRAARREICALIAALVAQHLADRSVEKRAMAILAVRFDPLALLAAERALLASLAAEGDLIDLSIPPSAAALSDLPDAALLTEAARILGAAARRRGHETVRLRKPA